MRERERESVVSETVVERERVRERERESIVSETVIERE